MEILDKFNNKKSNLISFEELKSFPENQIIQIRDKVGAIECVRLSNETQDLSFRVTMKKGELWEVHFHDCVETILLYKGVLIDKKTNIKISRMQAIEIKPFTEHIIESLEDSIFYVEFKKPK